MDVTAAAQSVGNMANAIVGAAAECGAIDTEKSGCGILVGQLLATTAGLSTRIGGIIDQCPNKLNPGPPHKILNTNTVLGRCIMDAKNSLKSVFKIMQGV